MSKKRSNGKTRFLFRGLKTQKGLGRKLKYLHYFRMADKNGVVPFRLDRIADEFVCDYYADTGIDRKEKEWYYRRGIPTFKIKYYGMTKENYNDYISEYDFYNAKNYIASQFVKWYDYKLTTYYLLGAYKEYMPRHYFFIRKGTLLPMDIDLRKSGSFEDIRAILKQGPIALKACTGGHGKGFYKIELRGEQYFINNQQTEEKDLRSLIASLDDYILTDFNVPHKVFRDACGEESFAILRPVVVFDEQDGPQITSILFRLGTSQTGLVSDYDGCINCGVDLETGKIFHPMIRSGDKEGIVIGTPISSHPDTGVDLETVTVPHFDELVEIVHKISAYLSMTPYLVMDIIPTDSGFKILEINSHGQVKHAEPFFPFRKNKYNLKVFQTRDW